MHSLHAFLHKLESAFLALLLFAMIGLGAYQVLARNLFESGLTWGDGFVRVAVLWITMIGAMVASRSDDHIRMDVVTRYLAPGARRITQRLTAIFTSAVCLLFAWYSVEFIRYEFADGTLAFGAVRSWICALVMPFGFATIGLRYLVRGILLPVPDEPADEPEVESL